MANHVDEKHLKQSNRQRLDASAGSLEVMDDVTIVVTQAYGPAGDSLMGLSDASFDGHPGVAVQVDAGELSGIVYLSPIHGDARKTGLSGIPAGTVCTLRCPVSGKPLDRVGTVEGGGKGEYFAIYLTEKLSEGEMVAISNVWDDFHSRIVDNFEMISAWAPDED
jgi:hypothetical protein